MTFLRAYRARLALPCLGLLVLTACVAPGLQGLAAVNTLAAPEQPAMGWDHRPEAAVWTAATLTALERQDHALADRVPGDIAAFCPAYPEASAQDRRAFWAGLLSAVAEYESGWDPAASGGGGRYLGLLQISPRTAANYGCDGASSAALKDGPANLACAVKIIAAQVGRDGLVAGAGNRGLARDWGPMKRDGKRTEIAVWTAAQDYCR